MASTTPNLLTLLGLPTSATHAQVIKAFKQAALNAHPDRGGSPEAMATLNAARDAYDGTGGGGGSGNNNNGGEDSDNDSGISMGGDNESDGNYEEDDASVSDGESISGSEAEVSSGEGDGSGWPFNTDYGDLEETGGSYKVRMEDGREISVEEHDKICGCDLSEGAIHQLTGLPAADDDNDSGIGDMDIDEDVNDEEAGNDGLDDDED